MTNQSRGGAMIQPLLDYITAASILGCSRSLVSEMALAAGYAAEVNAGQRAIDDVPPRLRRHLNEGFPLPIEVGRRIKRIDQRDLAEYLKRRKRRVCA